MSRAKSRCISGAGSVLSRRSIACSATTFRFLAPGGTMSSSSTATPALATCAAMPPPITPEPMTATLEIAMTCSRSTVLEDGGDALAAADALRGERIALALSRQQRRRLAGDARAAGPQGMAEGDGAAVEIGFLLVDAEFAHAGDRLRGESFVDLDDVDVLDGESGALQRLLRRRHPANAHDLRRATRDGDALQPRQNRQVVALGVILGADQHRRGAVGQRRRGAGGDRPLGVE